MDALKIVAALLILDGIFGIAYGGVSYAKAMHVETNEKQRLNIPCGRALARSSAGRCCWRPRARHESRSNR